MEDAAITFNIDVTCPDGNYSVYFEGTVWGAYGGGGRYYISTAPGGSHHHSGNPLAFTVSGGNHTLTLYGHLVDPVANGITPQNVLAISTNIDLTLQSEP